MRMARWRPLLACGATLLALASCRSDSVSKPLVNLLRNGAFEDGTTGWKLWSNGGVQTGGIEDGELGIAISNPASQPSDMGVGQQGFRLEHGAWYELSFRARGDAVAEITSVVQSNGASYQPYAPAHAHRLSGTMTRYARRFFMAYPTDAGADLEFFVGGRGAGTLHLDDVVLAKLGGGEDPGEPEVQFPKVVPDVDRSNLIVYEVNPFSYNGSASAHGRNLKGITTKLDRIHDLGVNCIWFTPVFDGTGMGYWTRDYYEVDPELGTLNDLKELVHEAHRRNILVVLDFVPNHTWRQHPFFQDVVHNHANSPYADYYLWTGTPGASEPVYYYDWDTLPNLNLANPEVREYLYRVAEYWIPKLDIDGYRVDVAWGLEDRAPGFGRELRRRVAALKPDAFLLGEGNVNEQQFFDSSYDAAYDWDLRGFANNVEGSGALVNVFDDVWAPQQLHETLARALPGLPFRFAENHDHPRAASLWGVSGSKVAHTVVLTSRGIPDVFGGGEVGFAPALDEQNDQVVWNFESPLYEYMKKVIAIRRQYLSSDLSQHWVPNDRGGSVYSSLAVSGTNRVLTVANFSSARTT